jgi:hypothetical protein
MKVKSEVNLIYTLSDISGNIRYVGVTRKTLAWRLRKHITESKSMRTHKDKWISSLAMPPVINLVEETLDRYRECYWIGYFTEIGCRLVNHTDGGEGAPGYHHSPETCAKMSKTRRQKYASGELIGPWKGKRMPKETRKKMSESRKGRICSPETRKKLSETHLKLHTLGMPTSMKGKHHTEKAKKKISESHKKRYANGGTHPNQGKHHTEETVKKIQAGIQAYLLRKKDENK